MKTPNLNLARRPFANSRPVLRLTLALWILGALLVTVNGVRYWRFLTGSEDRTQDLVTLEQRVVEHEERLTKLREDLSAYDVSGQNLQVTYLNQKIAARTFGWSELFDRMEAVLPDDVRLTSLSPSLPGEKKKRSRQRENRERDGLVKLTLRGVAKSFEAQLDLIDRLFQHPSFERPRLSRDQSNKNNQSEFDITVFYRPGNPAGELQTAAEVAALNPSGAGQPAGDRGALAAPSRQALRVPPLRTSPSGTSSAPGVAQRSIQPPAAVRSAPPVAVTGALEQQAEQAAGQPRENGQRRDLDEDPRDVQTQREQQARRTAPTDRRRTTAQRPTTPRPTTGSASFGVPSRAAGSSAGSSAGGSSAGGSGTPGFLPRQPSASSALEPR